MRAAIDILVSRWCISFIGVVLLLVGLVWLFGPLLPAFEDWPARAAVTSSLLLVWVGSNTLLDVRARRRDTALAQGITAGAAGEAQEVQALKDRMATALGLLRRSLRGR